jgi:hypothetical protein
MATRARAKYFIIIIEYFILVTMRRKNLREARVQRVKYYGKVKSRLAGQMGTSDWRLVQVIYFR